MAVVPGELPTSRIVSFLAEQSFLSPDVPINNLERSHVRFGLSGRLAARARL